MAGPSRYERCDVALAQRELQHVVSQALTPFHNADQRFVLVGDPLEAVPLQSYDPGLNDAGFDHGLLRGLTELLPGAQSGRAMFTPRPQPVSTPASSINDSSTDVENCSNPRRSQRCRVTRRAAADPFYAARGRSEVRPPRRTPPNIAANRHQVHIQGEPHRRQNGGRSDNSTFAAFLGGNVAVQIYDQNCFISISTPRSNLGTLQQIFVVISGHGLEVLSASSVAVSDNAVVFTIVCQASQNATSLNNNLHAALQTVVNDFIIRNNQ